MHVEKHWVRPATLSEKKLCKTRGIIFSIVFAVTLFLLIWVINSENANHSYFPMLVCFFLYIVSTVLDTVQVLGAGEIRIDNQTDYLTRDKWYHFFLPLSAAGFGIGGLAIFFLIGSIGFFIYSSLTGK